MSISSLQIDNVKWPCHLPLNTRSAILSISELRQGMSSFLSFNNFVSVPGLFYILQGSAGVSFTSNEVKKVIGGVVGKSDWLGANTFNQEAKYFLLTEEIEKLKVLLFPKDKLLDLANKDPLVYKFLFHTASSSHQIWMDILISNINDKQFKLIFILYRLWKKGSNTEDNLPVIYISQNQLSSFSGISPARLNEVLKHLEHCGYIKLKRGRIFILDPDSMLKQIQSMNMLISE